MRLLHTRNLQLETIIGKKTPGYAILSHTWGDDEVLFQDLQVESGQAWRERRGASKVLGAAAQAASDGHSYIWIDTCCIDKSSSAELSEAINSMYAWYKRSRVCYAYLEDILRPELPLLGISRWFTRGWTLQELIAPSDVQFFTSSWELLGHRSELAKTISNITRIDEHVLKFGQFQTPLETYPIGQRMTWASGRNTTRTEDIAYCLLGLFQVNMPLLYGEGRKAFLRLQEEILRQSTSKDHSLLLHRDSGHIFASQPSSFDIGCKLHRWTLPTEIGLVQDGVSLALHIQDTWIRNEDPDAASSVTLGVLDCRIDEGSGCFARPVIVMEHTSNGYYRHRSTGLMIIRPHGDPEAVALPGTHKPLNFHHQEPLDLSRIELDLARFERTSITLRHHDMVEYTHAHRRMLQLRLKPIVQPKTRQLYEFGPRRISVFKEILSISLTSDYTVFVNAAIFLKGPRDGELYSLLLLVGLLSRPHGLPDVPWARIISTGPMLTNEIKAEKGEKVKAFFQEALSADYLQPMLQGHQYDSSGVFLDPRYQYRLGKQSFLTDDGDVLYTRLYPVEFLGDKLYEVEITVGSGHSK